jgi:molecular chaperone HscC
MSSQTIIGIDLGTTNSLVAVFETDGPKLIPNAMGTFLTPSAVGYSDSDRLMTHPHLTAARFKRHMGTQHEVTLDKKKFRAEELSALVLGSLKADAETYLGQAVTEAVISVPAYFNDIQRKATIAAAEMAGLKVNRLVNEPTAAALAYGLQDRDGESTFLVVDLGGGTFDVSILEMFSGVMEVRASAGDAFLGGEDFTDTLANDLLTQMKVNAGALRAEDKARLRQLADRMKHQLTDNQTASANFTLSGEAKPVTMTRERFEEITEPILKRLRLPIQRAISDAGLRADNLNRIITVGGATRMPAVRGLVTKLFKRFPEYTIDPDHVIALGAGVQAGLAARHGALEDVVMTDVSPFTLGYEVSIEVAPGQHEAGHFSPLIERNTVVPVSRSNAIVPINKGQSMISLNIYQGESPYVQDNIKLGSLNVSIPVNHKEAEAVDVRYTYDTSGVLEVEATVTSTKRMQRMIIEGNPGALTAKQIEERFNALKKLKLHPRDEQENLAMKARLAAAYENALGQKRDYVASLVKMFESALHRQDSRHAAEVRDEIGPILDQIEQDDVF